MSAAVSYADRVRAHYDSYITAADNFFNSQRMAAYLNRMLSGAGRFSGSGLEEPFLKALEQLLREAAVQAPEEAETLLHYILLEEKVPVDHAAYAVLLAAEGCAVPLLSRLSGDALKALQESYRKKLRKTPGLPCQRQLEKDMRRLLSKI